MSEKLGMPTIDPADLICPACGAAAGESCLNRKTFHRERKEFAAKLLARCEGDSVTARSYRSRYRHKNYPKPPLPHGTMAGYARHYRKGEEPCEACADAARQHWADEQRAARAALRAMREADRKTAP